MLQMMRVQEPSGPSLSCLEARHKNSETKSFWLVRNLKIFKMKKLFCIIFLFVILPVVSGLGVSPGKIEIDFSPNLKTSFNMTVYNSPARNQDVKLYVGFSALDSDLISEFENIISLDTESFSV